MRNSIKYGIFLVMILSLLTLNVLALPNPSRDSIKLTNNSSQDDLRPANNPANNPAKDNIKPANNDKILNETIHLAISLSLEAYTHEDLSNYSDTIVIGTVEEILPSKWNTIDGKQPNKSVTELSTGEDIIYTDIIISVDKYIKNPLSSKEVIARVTGGTVGNISMGSPDEPKFTKGEKVLLYLAKDTSPSPIANIGPEHFRVTGLMQGKFTLTDDGKAIGWNENISQEELLSTINQTHNKTNDTGMVDNTGTVGKQEGNSDFTPELKSSPFISFLWMLATVFGAVMYVRKMK